MAEAEHKDSGGGIHLDGWFILLVAIVLIAAWLRAGGYDTLKQTKLNFGWGQVSSSTSPFPFTPNFQNLAPQVAMPSGPTGPQGPAGPK